MTSDWDIFCRARDGDERAWRELTSRHQARLEAIALCITGSGAAADDVVQETFVRALRARIRHHLGSVQGFLGTIAYRLALKEAQRARRDRGLEGIDAPDSDPDALDALLSSERDRHVAAVIRNLDAGHRDVLVLRFFAGHSYEEIAVLMHVPLGTVKSRIFYAVRSCREGLREEGLLE